MYLILEILADSEYNEGGFKFCGVYKNFKKAYKALKPNQFCVQIDKNETISDQIGPGIKVQDFKKDEKLTLNGNRYKVDDPQIIWARGSELTKWRVHAFEYYYNLNGTIYEANYILLMNYNHDRHDYADHMILLDDICDCEAKIKSDKAMNNAINYVKQRDENSGI